MKKIRLFSFLTATFFSVQLSAQTNLFDDVIAVSPNHNYLEAALLQEGLALSLQDPTANLTVFAPDDQAFEDLASALGTDIGGLLALDNLSDILLYHVLGVTVPASAVTNGAIVSPLGGGNTLKLTVTSTGNVFVNHAQVETLDLTTDNGIVHSIDAVLLPVQTVVDVALSNGFTTLATAVVTAELLPALSNPLATLTVFAPTNEAFDALAGSLGTDINGLLELPNLADVLTYHVLGTEVTSSAVTNGAIVQPLSNTNTLKLTATSSGSVFVNQAQVTLADVIADNGVVHVIDAVVLPVETVVDVAIDNGFSTLVTAVVTAELLPALSDPLASYTVFAPTNEAFTILAASLGTDITGLLNLPNLADVLLYHVLGSEVASSAVTNGAIVQPLSNTNNLKLTLTGAGNVFVNHAQVTLADVSAENGLVHVINAVLLPVETVVDVALDNGFTYLATAVITAELLPALTSPLTIYSVFAPTNEAFSSLASALGTDINGLLALPNLADVLTYHVIAGLAPSTSLSNGLTVQPISSSNTLKITVTSTGSVFVNQAQVTLADVTAYNGLVHVINEVVLPVETVVDVAIDNGFSTLTTAVIQEELVPVLSNPLASFTVFAPTNEAFDNLATALGTDINGILALPNLTDVLTYHVLGTEVPSSGVTNGAIVQPLSNSNTLKLTLTGSGNVFVNQAQVTLADVTAYNGLVHVINEVVLPVETVVDVAIENGFSTLTTAVIQEELVPVLSNPLASFTVFAPTNEAFDNLATALGTDINGILALPNLTDVLTYHVLGTEVLSTELTAGPVNTVNGAAVTVSLTNGVMINNANVTLADVLAYNGVVHVIDAVLLPPSTVVSNNNNIEVDVFPNPTQDFINIVYSGQANYMLTDLSGKVIESGNLSGNARLDLSNLPKGMYLLSLHGNNGFNVSTIAKQ